MFKNIIDSQLDFFTIALFLLIIIVMILCFRPIYRIDRCSFWTKDIPFVIIGIFIIIIIAIAIAKDYYLVSSDENDISERINIISSNLEETAKELSSIQQSLEARIDYVENLKEEAEIAENVISLSKEQVNAVQSKINQELNASSGKNTLMSFLISALFFALGLIVQPTINFFRRKNNKYINKNNETEQYNKEELLTLLNEAKNVLENNSGTCKKATK